MTYRLPTNNIQEFLKELNHIRRGIHPSVRGGHDSADHLLFSLCLHQPVLARAIANRLDYALYVDFHPLRIRAFANLMRENIRILKDLHNQ